MKVTTVAVNGWSAEYETEQGQVLVYSPEAVLYDVITWAPGSPLDGGYQDGSNQIHLSPGLRRELQIGLEAAEVEAHASKLAKERP